MIAIDTNALIYRLTEESSSLTPENRQLAKDAKAKFSEVYAKHERLAIPMPVLIEFANYLHHKFGRKIANETMDKLIADENFKIIDAKEEFANMAISVSEEYGADFSDSLIYSILYANGIKKILTYDKDFGKFPGIEIIR